MPFSVLDSVGRYTVTPRLRWHPMSSITPPPPPPPPPPPMSPPPGYVAYGGPGAQSGTFQGIGGISKAIRVLLWIYLPLQLLAVFDELRLWRQARRFLDGTITEQKFRDSIQVNASSIVGVLVAPIAVLTMIWMYRMASNLRKLGRQNQTWGPGWGIAAWFVPPCVAYVVPWLMFKELWKGSDPAVAAGDPRWKNGRVSPLVTWWWVIYGLIVTIGTIANVGNVQVIRSGETIRKRAKLLADAVSASVAVTIAAMVATVIYICLVGQLSKRHMQSTGES
jgi:hypothetical protein